MYLFQNTGLNQYNIKYNMFWLLKWKRTGNINIWNAYETWWSESVGKVLKNKDGNKWGIERNGEKKPDDFKRGQID